MSADFINQFELLWASEKSIPDVFAFLDEHEVSKPAEQLAVLLLDQRYRWRTDKPLQVEDYLAKLPDLASDTDARLQLAFGEFQSRSNHDTPPNIDEFTSRFNDISDSLRKKLEQFAYATTSFDSSASDRYIGRYRLERVLGQGAFGIVWLGFDSELHRQVAIKVPNAERFKKPEDAESYLAEARMVAKLDHANIVPVHDVGRSDDGSVYVVSKFIEGGTLADKISRGRPSLEESAKLIATCAMALGHAHEKRLIHRDVKPANILIEGRTSTAYVADFGLAIRDDDLAQRGSHAGTPAYMSPEQARGEGHRLDGRSDIFSLGVVLYELIVGRRPFRGSTPNELLHQVISVDPAKPRELIETIPAELERICLKALSKRASDRYATAAEFADDLRQWLVPVVKKDGSAVVAQITPKGLRSFDANDADFFLDLLPGQRNRDGLPESIAFWKRRIEQSDQDQTFSVGLIYGPSGCGKSSLVKAGLLPHLAADVIAVYVEATAEETELRILRGLRKRLPGLSEEIGLVDSLAALRRSSRSKIVIIIDQFEQWLQSHRTDTDQELVQALRQCDGAYLKSIVMVRDDFGMAAARFMDALDIPILQGFNYATVDLFEVDHAANVLTKFGQAFGKLPANLANLSADEKQFINDVANGLSQDGKVVSVRLSLFAEMIKSKPWTLQTLTDVGGTEGIGVNFLEDTFSSRNANPKHRLHEQAARAVLKSLLPEVATDIKGHMRSHAELLADSGYESRPADFSTLLRILDGELRLITPTDPAGVSDSSRDSSLANRYYQLTHDYMVPSLREWLTRKQQETRAGRAELKLAERTNLWTAKPENRYLPSILEWGAIRTLTDRAKWTPSQRTMMRRASRVHGSRCTAALATAMLLICSGLWIKSRVDQGQQRTTASGLVTALLSAETRDVPKLVAGLTPYRQWAEPELQAAVASTDAKAQLHARIALLRDDNVQVAPLQAALLEASPENVLVLRDVLQANGGSIAESYWKILEATDDTSPQRRLAAGAALAKFTPDDPRWTSVAGHVSKLLVDENPLWLATWIEAFRPVRASLVPELGMIFRDQSESVSQTQRDLATNMLETFVADNIDQLSELIIDAQPKQFVALFDEFKAYGDAAKDKMLATLERKPARPALWDNTNVVSLLDDPVPNEALQKVESADGKIADRFALVQTLPLDRFMTLAETLGESGYRPIRLRPYNSLGVKPNPTRSTDVAEPLAAAVWHRDGRDWRVAIDLTADEMMARDGQLRGEGFAAVDVAGYITVRVDLPTELFTAVWVKRNAELEDSRLYLSTTDDTHKTAYEELAKAGFKLANCLHVFRGIDGQPRYSGVKVKQDIAWNAVWDRSPNNYGELLYLDRPQWDVNLSLGKSAVTINQRLDREISEETAVLEKSPNSRNARMRRAIALYHRSKTAEAIIDLDMLIEANPTFPDAYQYRSLCNAQLGNREAADGDLTKLRELIKSDATIAFSTAVFHAYFGEFTEAEKTLTIFSTLIPEQGDGLYSLACAYATLASIAKPSDQALSTKYENIAIENLKTAIASKEIDTEQILIESDFDTLRERPALKSLLGTDQLDRRYAAVWNPVTGLESRELHGMSAKEHRKAMQTLEDDGFTPVAVSVLALDTDRVAISASVWQRKVKPEVSTEKLAKQQANAAVAMVRLGEGEKVWPLLKFTPDPRLRTWIIHRLSPLRADAETIISQYRTEADTSIRRALILCLGEFDLLSTNDKTSLSAELLDTYENDPDAGIHGAAEWVLKRWNQQSEIAEIDARLATGKVESERHWYQTKQGHTMVVIPGPIEFVMGSPATEQDLQINEILHLRRINHKLAISTKEVTVNQFQQFLKQTQSFSHHYSKKNSPEFECPQTAITWYDAAAYCRWLSESEGISEDQMCYPSVAEIREGMSLPTDYLSRTGYRLPSEAEWELACRAGTITARFYGESDEQLGRYGWNDSNSTGRTLPVGNLKPNEWGLFDTLGNVYEWCQDQYVDYNRGKLIDDREDTAAIQGTVRRIFRGGAKGLTARSAYRSSYQPGVRYGNLGVRVARTCP